MADDPLKGLPDFSALAKEVDFSGMANQLGDVNDQLLLVSQRLETLIDLEIKSAKSGEDLSRAIKGIFEKAKDASEGFSRLTDKMLYLELVQRAVVDSVTKLASGSNVASVALQSAASALNVISANFHGFGRVAGFAVAGVKALVDAYDASIKAQRAVVNAQLEAGLSYANHSAVIDSNRKRLEATAAAWGVLGEDAAKALSMASGAGLGARPGETGAGRARSVGEDLDEAFKASIASAKAYGLSQEETMQSVVQFGTVFSAKGREFSTLMGEVTEAGQKSTLGQKRYLESIRSITDMTKEQGSNLFNTNVMLLAFDKQLKDGSMTLDTIAKLANPTKLTTEGLGFVTAMAMQAGKAIGGVPLSSMGLMKAMDQVALSSEKINEAMKKGGAKPEELAESLTLVLDALKAAVPDIAEKSGTEIKGILGSLGIDVSIKAATQIFKQDVTTTAKEMAEAGKRTKEGDPAERLSKAGEAVFVKFRTSGEMFTGATVMFRDAVTRFLGGVTGNVATVQEEVSKREASGQSAIGAYAGVASDILTGAVFGSAPTGGGMTPYVAERMKSQDRGGGGLDKIRSFDTGGFVPDTGNYKLHAGERVVTPGGSSGAISVSVGGVSVTVGERGDLRSQLHEAMAQVEASVLQKIEEQWRSAALAQ